MIIRRESLHHYLRWIKDGRHFCLAGFSDAEWYCILGEREGEPTGLGQTISAEHGLLLADVLRRRQSDPRFLPAVPECLFPCGVPEPKEHFSDDLLSRWPPDQFGNVRMHFTGYPGLCEGQVDWWLGANGISLVAYERDSVTDDLARRAELFPLIQHVRGVPSVMVGPEPLREFVCRHLQAGFVPIASPNLHLAPGGIDAAVEGVLRVASSRGMVLVSAGVSAAIIIDRLMDRLPLSWMMDCGSIWDAFAGIGGQRQWRKELYADPIKLSQWRWKNLHGDLRLWKQ